VVVAASVHSPINITTIDNIYYFAEYDQSTTRWLKFTNRESGVKLSSMQSSVMFSVITASRTTGLDCWQLRHPILATDSKRFLSVHACGLHRSAWASRYAVQLINVSASHIVYFRFRNCLCKRARLRLVVVGASRPLVLRMALISCLERRQRPIGRCT